MGAFRGSDIILPWNIRHCLLILAKSTKGKKLSDQIVSEVMEAWLQANHPAIWQFVQEQQQREDVVIEGLAAAQPKPSTKAKTKPKPQQDSDIIDNIPDTWPTEVKQA